MWFSEAKDEGRWVWKFCRVDPLEGRGTFWISVRSNTYFQLVICNPNSTKIFFQLLSFLSINFTQSTFIFIFNV